MPLLPPVMIALGIPGTCPAGCPRFPYPSVPASDTNRAATKPSLGDELVDEAACGTWGGPS